MERFTEKGISRRQLFEAAAIMGAATIGAGLLGGCSSARNVESSQAVSSSGAAQSGAAASQTTSSASATSVSSSAGAASSSAAGGALVAVFSWSGNTLSVADRVAEDLQAELFRIEPAIAYTDNYDEMLQIAQDEQAAGTMPAISAKVQDWDKYTTIYLGFPTWWGHLPQIVKSFLAEHDCAGKVVYPFNTHGGSGFASCLTDLAEACPGADVRDGISLPGDSVSSSSAQIDAWATRSV